MRRRVQDGDEGMALVIALLVTLISFILVTSVLAQAYQSVSQAGYLRRRIAAVHAAEAGLNWYTNYMSGASLNQLKGWTPDGDWWRRTSSDIASGPDQARFTVRVRYVAENPCLVSPCTPTGDDPLKLNAPLPDPMYAIVRSTGCAASSASNANVYPTCPGGVSRTLESAVRLHPTSADARTGAGLIGTSLCFDSSGDLDMIGGISIVDPTGVALPAGYPCLTGGVAVGGGGNISLAVTDGDIYIDGSGGITVSGGGKLQTTDNLWAEGPVTLSASGATPTACGSTDTCVFRDVIGSLVTVGSGVYLGGQTFSCGSGCPLDLSFPKIVYDADYWKNWAPASASSGADALSLASAATSPTVVRISGLTASACNVEFPDATDVVLQTDVAIVSECGFRIGQTDSIKGTGGAGSLILMSAWPGSRNAVGAAPSCGAYGAATGWRGIRIENNPAIGVPLSVYTPCELYLQNNASVPIAGQFVARFIWVNQAVKLASAEVLGSNLVPVPGIVRGFGMDVRYIREIPNP